jgi:hypothetical protein
MGKLHKNVQVKLSEIVNDRSRNVRENDAATYNVQELKDDLALRGQITTALFERQKLADGKVVYYPLQGFLRTTAIMELAEAKVIDPNTVKRDEKGDPIPGTGKVFSTINADVWEDLTERERISLLADHGQRRGLTRAELFYTFERFFAAGFSEKECVVYNKSLLLEHFPPNKTIEKTDDAIFQYYRGVIQTNKAAANAPILLRNAWVEKLKGLHSWPTKAELADGAKIFNKALDSDKTGTINRENPGPDFMEFWGRLTTAASTAAAEGNKPKPVSMASRNQIEEMQKTCSSRCLKAMTSIILNDGKVERSKLATLDQFLAAKEKLFTEDEVKILDLIFGL